MCACFRCVEWGVFWLGVDFCNVWSVVFLVVSTVVPLVVPSVVPLVFPMIVPPVVFLFI